MNEQKRREARSWNLPLEGVAADKAGYDPGRRFCQFCVKQGLEILIVDFLSIDFQNETPQCKIRSIINNHHSTIG